MNNDQSKRFTDRAARTASEAADSARGAQDGYSAIVNGIRDFNFRLMEMAHANTLAALDFSRDVSSGKGPTEAAALWSSYARQQFETLTEQSKELTALAQRVSVQQARSR
jgi:hypothetical protein